MAATKSILVAGATGKQGGALINSLLSCPQKFNIIALTRNTSSAAAQRLVQNKQVTLLEGDLNDCPAVFKKLSTPIHGVFSVQTPLKPKVEEQQGKDLVDAAATYGVKHFVYTSADRGGPKKSDHDGTIVPHFISKFNIENHLKSVATQRGMDWTIIRPVAFMDNLTNDFIGKAFHTMWKLNRPNSKLQLVASQDIGKLAALVFQEPEEFRGKALSFATDELTVEEADQQFKAFVGKDMPSTYLWIGSILKFLLHDQLGIMFKWFVDVGFGANPKEFKDRIPSLMNFDEWLRTESGFKNSGKERLV